MKVLLILAAIPELKASSSVRYPVMAPPLTLPLLSAVCRRAGFEVELIDTRLYMERSANEWVLNYAALEKAISLSTAEVAGISFLSSSAKDGYSIAALCKAHGKTVVGGGLHASVALDEFINDGSFHYIVLGEGEEIFPSLLNDLADGRRERFPAAAVVMKADLVRDLSIVPPVTDFSLYGDVYQQYPSYRSMYVETSRGCFKQCTFCEVARTGAAWSPFRKMPLENAFYSLDRAVPEYGVNYVIVTDSIATFFKSHFLSFVTFLSKNFQDLTAQFNSTVDCWDRERAEACQKIRCNVWFGFESGSQRILDEVIRKGATVAQAYDAARLCERHGIPCAFNVLLGLPGETEDDYLKTMEIFSRCDWIYPNPNIFNPLPGTSLFAFCQSDGTLRSKKDYSVWDADRIKNSGGGPVKGVDYSLVLKYYDMLMQLQSEPRRALL